MNIHQYITYCVHLHIDTHRIRNRTPTIKASKVKTQREETRVGLEAWSSRSVALGGRLLATDAQ